MADGSGNDKRIPVGVDVELRFTGLDRAHSGTTRDISKSGMCVVVPALAASIEKIFAEGGAPAVEVHVAIGRRRLCLPGTVTWQRRLRHGNDWLLGLEYVGAPEQAAEVVELAVRLLHRPRVLRGMALAATSVLVLAALFFGWYQDERAAEIVEIDRRLHEAVRLRSESATQLETLRNEIASLEASTSSQSEQLASKSSELALVQRQFETLRQQVGELSVSRSELSAPSGGRSGLHHLERGHHFSKQNNLAAALIEYQRAVELAPELAEAHLEIAVISDLYGRLPDAIASYRRYLALRPDALDAYEIRTTIRELESEAGAPSRGGR